MDSYLCSTEREDRGGSSLLHCVWGLFWKTRWPGAGIIWKLICSHVWHLMLAIGKDFSCSFQPECLHAASLCGLRSLTAQWLCSRASVPRAREKAGSLRSHFHCVLRVKTEKSPLELKERRNSPTFLTRCWKNTWAQKYFRGHFFRK